jgi:hypothetical protein
MYVVEVTYHEMGVIGVFTKYEDAKKLADSILIDYGEYAIVYEIELNIYNLLHSHHKIIYNTEVSN